MKNKQTEKETLQGLEQAIKGLTDAKKELQGAIEDFKIKYPKTPRSIKYSNAALAGQQVTINGQNFGLFVVEGQNVYLGNTLPTPETLFEINIANGIYYPAIRWSLHLARNQWQPIRAAIMQQLETAKLYGFGFFNLCGGEVVVIAKTDLQGGMSRLKKAGHNTAIKNSEEEIKEFLNTHFPTVQVLPEIKTI